MNTLSLTSLVLFSILSFTSAHAQTDGSANPIRDLDNGACWAQGKQEDGVWKIASFNDNQTFYVFADALIPDDQQRFQNRLTIQLKNLFSEFKPSPYKMHLHCGGGGHLILISIENPDMPLCVWAKKSATSNSSLDIQGVFPDPNSHEGEPCYGVVPGVILATVKKDENPQELADYMSKAFSGIIESIRVSKVIGYLSIKLKNEYKFHEADAKKAFESDSNIVSQTTTISYDNKMTILGEDVLLLAETYPGF